MTIILMRPSEHSTSLLLLSIKFTLQQVALQDIAHVNGRGTRREIEGPESVCFKSSCASHDRPYQALYRHNPVSSVFR
jgi:hypothetical protein